jgi:hypothetical protein
MAKDQNISLNPTKISGLCGRLMCCLEHEHNVYKEIKPRLKKVGNDVMTPDGPGTVIENLILLEQCKVRVTFPGEVIEIRAYPLEEVKNISREEAEKQYQIAKNKKPKDIAFKNPNETWDDEAQAKDSNQKNNSNKKNRRRKKRYSGKPKDSKSQNPNGNSDNQNHSKDKR